MLMQKIIIDCCTDPGLLVVQPLESKKLQLKIYFSFTALIVMTGK